MLSSRNVRSWFAVALPFSMIRRRSASRATSVSETRDRSRAKLRMADALSSWVLSTTRLSLSSWSVMPKLWFAVSMNDVELSISRLRSSPPSWNAAPNSSTTVRRSCFGTELTRSLVSLSHLDVEIGIAVFDIGDVATVGEVGLAVGLRLQLDVLLADRRPVADQRLGVGRDLVLGLVDVEVDVDAVAR